MEGPLEEKPTIVGASVSLPVIVRAGSIMATGELLKPKSTNFTGKRVFTFPKLTDQGGREECNLPCIPQVFGYLKGSGQVHKNTCNAFTISCRIDYMYVVQFSKDETRGSGFQDVL